MGMVKAVKDKARRHKERHTPLGFPMAVADRIDYLVADDWDRVARGCSVFLSRDVLRVAERFPPGDCRPKYAIAYQDDQPVVIVACQIATASGEQLLPMDSHAAKPARHYRERLLVCGNLVSSGLHGIGFCSSIDEQTGWRIVAEILYRIRRAEKLDGDIDFVLIKDVKGERLPPSEVIERYSYRRIQTDPDMVLHLDDEVRNFDDYLNMLTSKYRSRVRKVRKTVEKAGFECAEISLDEAADKTLHGLYLAVENKSPVRLAALPEKYFAGLAEALGDHFSCRVIRSADRVAGFVTVIRDGDAAVAYYVGIDYEINETVPIYFRLLQMVVEAALDMGCRKISFGRTALEPKANLGAKPVDAFAWARHRIPVVNYMVRRLFRNVPFDAAPERSALKEQD